MPSLSLSMSLADELVTNSAPFAPNGPSTTLNDVPLLIGSTAQAIEFYPGPDSFRNWTWSTYSKYVTTSLDSFDPLLTRAALEHYPVPRPTAASSPSDSPTQGGDEAAQAEFVYGLGELDGLTVDMAVNSTTTAQVANLRPDLLYSTMVTDLRQVCPVNHLAANLSSLLRSPIYRYVVTERPSHSVSLHIVTLTQLALIDLETPIIMMMGPPSVMMGPPSV